MSEQNTATLNQEEAAPKRAAFSFARKKPFRTIRLSITEDYKGSGGGPGVLPMKTMDRDDGFDPSWSVLMLFHDVFEHWQEYEHRYFQGDYAMNVGGEMYAMGAMTWFISRMGVYQRLNSNGFSIYSDEQRTVQTTLGLMTEAVFSGYCSFGARLECAVPYQKRGHHYADNALENMLAEYRYMYQKELVLEYRRRKSEVEESGHEYRKSVTMSKITRLHRYGYYHAQRTFPDSAHNRITLQDFWTQWSHFIDRRRSFEDDIQMHYKELRVQLYYLNEHRDFTWRARFIPINDPDYVTEEIVLHGPTTVLEY